jgi:hypothetical protein
MASQKIWQRRESNPGPVGLQPGLVTTRPQRRSNCNTRLGNVEPPLTGDVYAKACSYLSTFNNDVRFFGVVEKFINGFATHK